MVSSANTVLRVVKELATDNTKYASQNGIGYNFNINNKLNRLNIKFLFLTKQLEVGSCYNFDYDNQIIAIEKYDIKCTYKIHKEYCSVIATIRNKIVYIEIRNGSANVKINYRAHLERLISH